ncbi:glucose dehydrogenase [Tamilnaduibacter salinus]|uniref:Glucose dehydrogenase n=2 Tax=Tamilnaduibacter salinus TaxID=1484056 RepID=A0A2A2I5X7_9GAMM|nr:PQQ-dependent sugar dehydrogenase [Tamilnaduibacter salinus]PAV27139.1 glucose dehydrogenase [Tamilnaduibacter salinus]
MRALILIFLLFPLISPADTYSSRHHDYRVETIASGLDHPWAMTFLPNGDTLITERAGQLRILRDGRLLDDPVSGVPEVAVAGQGGLLDIELHPDFQNNRQIVLSYAHETWDGMTTRVAKARYESGALTDVTPIFTALPRSNTSRHFAGRMAFDAQENLYIAVGDRGEMERAQDLGDDAGGVHRITMAGEPAPNNPPLDDSDVNDTFYTVGNRNIQGMTRHPETGVIWTHEHGPRGGDEVNIIRAGTNYGWPVITHGIGYSGLPISDKTHKEGMAQPLHFWDPSIAPSGMTFYDGDRFPNWQGDLFVGALKFQKVVRLRIRDDAVIEEEDLLSDLNHRIRAVRQGPDEALWVLTDSSNGRVLRITPAQSDEP